MTTENIYVVVCTEEEYSVCKYCRCYLGENVDLKCHVENQALSLCILKNMDVNRKDEAEDIPCSDSGHCTLASGWLTSIPDSERY